MMPFSSLTTLAGICGLFLAGFLLISFSLEASDKPVLKSNDYVILLHGMARTENSMSKLEKHLVKNNYIVINTGYPSTRETVETIAEKYLADMVNDCIKKGAGKIHIVTHSLGGIVTRQYLQSNSLPVGSRIVMISPPNKGSELVDAFRDLFIFDWLYGPAGQELGTEPDSLPNSLKPVSGEIGVIAGDFTFNPLYSWIISGEDDGKVSVESAKLDEMADFLVVPSSHSFIMNHSKVLKQVVCFLENGKFEHFQEN